MGFSVKIGGLDRLQQHLEEIQAALKELDGRVAQVRVNPNDESSIAAAICEVDEAVDQRLAAFAGNPTVQGIAAKFKAAASEHIRSRAKEARAKGPEV